MSRKSDRSALRASRSSLPNPDWAQLEQVLEQFEDAWQRGERPNIGDFLGTAGEHRLLLLVELVHEDLEYRLKANEPARVEVYLQRYPELAEQAATVFDLIAWEYQLRQRREKDLTLDEYRRRFPQ